MLYSYLNVTYQFVCHMVLCNEVLPRLLTKKAGEDVTESVQRCVYAWGNFPKIRHWFFLNNNNDILFTFVLHSTQYVI